VLFVHVTSVLCCSVLSNATVLASCQTCTPDNENYYCHHNGDQLDVIDCVLMNVMCPQPSTAATIHSTDDDDVNHLDDDDDS